jgi:outer membrane protein OmpA-like peptidoglycan-associated protein
MRKIILTGIALCLAFPIWAQNQDNLPKQQNRHEFFVGGGGGISAFQHRFSAGSRQTGFNYNAELGYNYFFNYNWGLGIAGEFSFLSLGSKFDHLTDQSLVSSSYFDYYQVVGKDVTEKQKFYHINVPILARYQVDLPGKITKFYVAAGPKLGIPFKNSYKSTGILTTTGAHFPNLDGYTRDPFDDMPHHGFYPAYSLNHDGELDTKLYVSGTIETGLKFTFNQKWGLYTGLFADFGLNDIVKRSSDRYPDFVGYNYDIPADPIINSMLVASHGYVTADNGGMNHRSPFLKRANTISAGIKVALTFGIDPIAKKERAKKAEPVKEPYEGLTEAQLRAALADRNNDLIRAQQKEFQDLKDFLAKEKEQPDLSATIYCFDFDKDNIPNDMKGILDGKVKLMKDFPQVNITLEGHTDQAGSDRYNVQLGLRRAEAVKAYMMSKGIAAGRMNVTSKGKSAPIYSGTDEQARCRNRRVEFIINN